MLCFEKKFWVRNYPDIISDATNDQLLLQNAVQLKTAQTKKTKQQASAHMAGKR
jgi:hypothetical protein